MLHLIISFSYFHGLRRVLHSSIQSLYSALGTQGVFKSNATEVQTAIKWGQYDTFTDLQVFHGIITLHFTNTKFKGSEYF